MGDRAYSEGKEEILETVQSSGASSTFGLATRGIFEKERAL